jgi:ABC-type Mn2+/Zn2+ transport system permease subunit
MILFSMLLSFVLLNLGVVLMVHYSVWIGLTICIVSGVRFLRDIDISRNSKGYYSQRK